MEIKGNNTINNDPAIMGFYSDYRKMKSKYRLQFDDNFYSNIGYNVLLSMFEYDEKLFRPELFDMILHDTGIVALIKTDTAEYTPVFCNLVGGNRYADGFFKNAICYDMTATEYKFSNWRENENILVFFNNLTYSPDTFIDKYSTMLSDCDGSIINNVLFSRLKPLPIAEDQKSKNQIDKIMQDLMNNQIETVLTDNKLREIIDGKSGGINVLNLTNVEHSKYIQYLSHLHDDLISRYFMCMGISVNDTGKMAQISRDELNKNKSASIAITNGWFKPRYDGFEIAKQKTGKDWYFDYSEIWKNEIAKTETDENGNTVADMQDSQLSENTNNDEMGDSENEEADRNS